MRVAVTVPKMSAMSPPSAGPIMAPMPWTELMTPHDSSFWLLAIVPASYLFHAGSMMP